MKALLLTAAMLAAALPSAAAMPAAIDQDPLMRQILSKQLTHPNGGVTAAVAVKGAANGISLELADPLAPLKPAEGLVERPAAQAPAKKAGKKPQAGRPVPSDANAQAGRLAAAGDAASFERAAK